MSHPTVAAHLVETLVGVGVKRIYGVAGDSLNALTETLRTRDDLAWVHVRHEETAAFAAGAEAQLTGELAVCAGSCGPGNLHLINGLFDAHRSRAPVLAIAAQIPSAEIGSDYFQETHPESLFKQCSHFCELVSDVSQLPQAIERAIREALGRRGVAVLVIPGDVLAAEGPKPRPPAELHAAAPLVRPTDAELDKLVALLEPAKKVTLLCGIGCAGAHAEVIALAAQLQAPIVHSLRGKQHLEYDNPYDVGMTGLLGFESGYRAMMHSEVLLMLGTDFPYRQFYPEKAKVAQLDVRAENLGRRTRIDLGLVGEVKATIAALLPKLAAKTDRSHLDDSLKHYVKAREGLDELATGDPGHVPIHPQYLTRVIDQLAASDAVFSCDVGTPTVWAARYLTMNGKRELLGSFVHGSMASALPQALGAQASHPGRQVISLSGDGGFSMLMGDFISLSQLGLPVKVVIYDKRRAGLRRARDESGRAAHQCDRAAQPRLRRDGQRDGCAGHSGHRARPGARCDCKGAGPPRPGAGRRGGEPARADDAAQNHAHPGEGVQQLRGQGGAHGRGDEVIDLAKSNWFR